MIASQDAATITVPKKTPLTDINDIHFGLAENDEVVLPITKMARLRWFNGAATDQQTLAVGWHIEHGINPIIDETLEGMGMNRYVVEHRMPDKDGKTQKPYWRLYPCSLIVVAEGVLTTFQMRDSQQRTGIAYAREIELDEHGDPKRYPDGKQNLVTHKVLKLRAFVHEMLEHGYSEWFPLVLTGNIVDCMLDALTKQIDVLKAFHGYTGRNAPFYGFSLPLAPAPTRKMVGQGEQKSPIYPMLAQLPATIDTAYLLKHAIPQDLAQRIREELLPEAINWSIQESARLGSGLVLGGEAKPEGLPEPPHPSNPLPAQAARMESDPLVKQPQIDWIVNTYCGRNQGILQAVLEAFSQQSPTPLTDVTQLRMSHFHALVKNKQEAEAEAQAALRKS